MKPLQRAWLAIIMVVGGITPAFGQFAMDGSNESGLPGDTVTAVITMDNSQPARGFSFGLLHDGLILTLTDIQQGAVVLATNGGAGADFFYTDLAAPGGTGGVVGCVVSLSAPIEEIASGTGQEIALIDYSIGAGATPATVTPLSFTDTLGNPPILLVISVGGTSMPPVTTDGSVTVLTPPVSGLSCTLTDVCTCETTLGWTNGAAYDSISIFENGNLVTTLPGGSTGAVINLSGFGTFQVDVVPVAGGIAGASVDCLADCPVLPTPPSPENLDCAVDHILCEANVTWTNPAGYDTIEVSLDGVPVATLPGSATSALVTLPGPGTYDICLNGTDAAGCVAFLEVCCAATCFPPFARGDGNEDGVLDVSDPILVLGFALLGEPANCVLALDANDDESVGIPDAIYLLGFIFQGGPTPPAPFPACGPDSTPGGLTCDSFTSCP